MQAMKKEYKSPKTRMIELDMKDQLLDDSSYTPIGGTTDKFGAKKNKNDDWEEEEF